MPALDPVLAHLLSRIERRLRLRYALEVGAWVALFSAAALLVTVYLFRLRLLERPLLIKAALLLTAAPLGAVLVLLLRRRSADEAAQTADEKLGLKNRLRSALHFSRAPEPTDFMRAAIADAIDKSCAVDAATAAPLHRPKHLGPTLGLLGAAGAVLLLHFPAHSSKVVPPPRLRLVIDEESLAPERRALERMVADADEEGDEALSQLGHEMQRLLDQVAAAELTREEVFEKLAALEQRFGKADDKRVETLKAALHHMGDGLRNAQPTREVAEALAKEDLKKAREELHKLAEAAEQLAKEEKTGPKNHLSSEARDMTAKALERAARDVAQPDEETERLQKEEARLKEEARRLKRQQAERPNDEEVKRRLQRNQRQLERLEREKEARTEQRRQLERLERELQKAAEELRSKMSPEALKQLQEELGQMENEIKKLGSAGQAKMQIAELKEVLRRAGGSQSADGSQAKGADGQKGQKGGSGQGKGQKGGLREQFEERAGAGGDKKADTFLLGGSGGKNSERLLLPLPIPGRGPGPGRDPGQGSTGTGESSPSAAQSPSAGDGHDPNLLGQASRLHAKAQATRVQGQEGAGPSREETIRASAQRGFASASYRRVYTDYSSLVEEVMSKEEIPPGYRYYVKRYFQLIKPRE